VRDVLEQNPDMKESFAPPASKPIISFIPHITMPVKKAAV
jgi:hypothetical protein